MEFQKGDVCVRIKGRPYTLRLTLGALAEISGCLSAPSPKALSQRLRTLTAKEARVLLGCLSCPPLCGANGSEADVTDEEMKTLLPDICRVFERAFETPKEAS